MMMQLLRVFPLVRWEPHESTWALAMTTAKVMMQLLWILALAFQEAGERAYAALAVGVCRPRSWVPLLLPMRPLVRREWQEQNAAVALDVLPLVQRE